MVNLLDLFDSKLYSIANKEKELIFFQVQKELCKKHYLNSIIYRNIIDGLGINLSKITKIEEIPFIPASLYKSIDFMPTTYDFIRLESSGTNGKKSFIKTNQFDVINQKKALLKNTRDFINLKRKPMIVLSDVENGKSISAKSAGALGFMLFGKDILRINQNDCINQILDYVRVYGDEIIIYGTTIDLYQKLIKDKHFMVADLRGATIITGGGWKNRSETLSLEDFFHGFKTIWNIDKIYDFYGMTEQLGNVYFRCECGNYHCSAYSDIIIRNPIDFNALSFNKQGIVQTLCGLDINYPTNSILTEDYGMLMGIDDCPCGRNGKYFKILGRLRKVEHRGCSYEK